MTGHGQTGCTPASSYHLITSHMLVKKKTHSITQYIGCYDTATQTFLNILTFFLVQALAMWQYVYYGCLGNKREMF